MSICIRTLPVQHTMFISLYVSYVAKTRSFADVIWWRFHDVIEYGKSDNWRFLRNLKFPHTFSSYFLTLTNVGPKCPKSTYNIFFIFFFFFENGYFNTFASILFKNKKIWIIFHSLRWSNTRNKLLQHWSSTCSLLFFELESTSLNKFSQLATTKFCCVKTLEVGGNTWNNAFEPVLPGL